MKLLNRWFWLIFVTGFLVRLIVAALAPHPGIADPNHYFNLATNLAEGRGFVIDYVWQYHSPPPDLTHSIDYWMPLPAVYPAIALFFFPDSLFAALVPSVIFGALIPALAYGIAILAGSERRLALLSMLSIVFLPELVLNSARTDTTTTYILFIGISSITFYLGLRRNHWWLLSAGFFAGLAHLTRQDSVLLVPSMIVALIFYWRADDHKLPWLWLLLIPLGWIGVMSPWFIRNFETFGVLLPSHSSRTMFMTSFIDQFTYARELTLEHYLDWGAGNIIGNWITQALANIQTMYKVLDIALPITALMGLGLMFYRREREKLLLIALPAIMVIFLFLFYSFVTPFHTQGGSFKKSYLLIVPFLGFAGTYALWVIIPAKRYVVIFTSLMAGFMFLNTIALVREDFDLARRFDASIKELAIVLNDYGDVNGDGEIVVMTQDPFALNKEGFRTLMIPSDDRDSIMELAYRYNVDYIQLPAGRESLDGLLDNNESDPRLIWREANPGFQLLEVIPPE